jgi:hypothetical protein
MAVVLTSEVVAELFFFLKKFWNAKNDPKLSQRGVMFVISMPGKRFWNAILACVLLRKNFRNGGPAKK